MCVDAALSGPRQAGRRGESCRVSSECGGGLSCVGEACVPSAFAISPTANECKVVECEAARDCCPVQPAFCAPLSTACAAEQALVDCAALDAQCDAGVFTACDDYAISCPSCSQYDASCECDVAARRCDAGACRAVTPCAGGACPTGVCDPAAGECVACLKAEDCGDAARLVCNDRRCEPRCTDDTDCPAFNRCSAGACVASGCKSDRECKAATRNALATCAPDGSCSEPCESDPECGSPDAWNFRACLEGRCVYVGCESDKECQFYLAEGGLPPGPPLSGQRDIVCVPRAPGAAPAAP